MKFHGDFNNLVTIVCWKVARDILQHMKHAADFNICTQCSESYYDVDRAHCLEISNYTRLLCFLHPDFASANWER